MSTSTGIRVKRSTRRSETSELKGCCAIGFLIFGLCAAVYGIIASFYYTISVALPTCSVVEFYATALDKSVVSNTTSDSIFFKISFKDSNIIKGVQYSPVNLTFFYGSDSTFPIGNYVVPSFYQASIQKRGSGYLPIVKSDMVSTHGVPWKAARELATNGSTVSFRVGLDATVRFKYMDMILNKKHKMSVGATLKVDDSGNKVGKSVYFRSGATSARRSVWMVLAVAFSITFYLMCV